MADPIIHILMATYNGARYLREQIESIQAQTYHHWRLLLRDDGSIDNTRLLARDIAYQDRRVAVIEDEFGPQGPAGNFSLLLRYAQNLGAEYIAFADQDDVWLPNKLSESIHCLLAGENLYGSSIPILVHTDLTVADELLIPIAPSFLKYQRLRHEPNRAVSVLLSQNFVTGCTCLLNRALLDVMLPIPPHAVMHDWWAALCAAVLGKLEFLPESTVLYRQHSSNTIGAKGFCSVLELWKRLWSNGIFGDPAEFLRTVAQAMALRNRLESVAGYRDVQDYHLVADFCHLFEADYTGIERLVGLLQTGVHRQDLLRQLLLWKRLLLLGSADLQGFSAGPERAAA